MNKIMMYRKVESIDLNVLISSSRFQHMLMRMLQEEENSCIIEWVNGKIVIHDPRKMETNVLSKYFKHSNYLSFQRQLNNFGFRKMKRAGSGRYERSVYAHESTTLDIHSIMLINNKAFRKSSLKKDTTIKSNSNLNANKGKKKRKRVKFNESKQLAHGTGKRVLFFDVPTCGNSKCKCCSNLNEMTHGTDDRKIGNCS